MTLAERAVELERLVNRELTDGGVDAAQLPDLLEAESSLRRTADIIIDALFVEAA